jgi:uncharacterized protein (TIGR02271 family)
MSETIVAVFETGSHADQAASALKAAGVQSSAIERHSKESAVAASGQGSAPKSTGFFFWDMMLGVQAQHQDRPSYERSVERGETVLAVTVSDEEADKIMAVLEKHSPVDLEGTSGSSDAMGDRAAPAAKKKETAKGEEVIQLAEEELQVGKRTVNRGTTRIRRYVVETPVEQTVSLKDQTVTIERRKPVVDEATGDVLTEKTVEVNNTSEIPVSGKIARLKEEVVVHRQSSEHTETVRDTVRQDRVDVEDASKGSASSRDTVRHQEIAIETVPAVETATATRAAAVTNRLGSKH